MKVKKVLLYGDSNTYGYVPEPWQARLGVRYPEEDRYPGVLRQRLGPGFEIIEQGLPGRNSCRDDFPSPGVNWNGRATLPEVLGTALPVDLLVIMLGTNDLKHFADLPDLSAKESAQGVGELVELARTCAGDALGRILLLAPPPFVEGEDEGVNALYAHACAQAQQLPAELERVAEKLGCAFFDLSKVVSCADGPDGLHLSAAAHQLIGVALGKYIRSLNL